MSGKSLDLFFTFDKSTKSKIRYKEKIGETPTKAGTFYLEKWAMKKIGKPRDIKVTIVVDGESVLPEELFL